MSVEYRVGNSVYIIYLSILLTCAVVLTGCAAIKPKPQYMPPPDVRSILATLKMRYDLVDSMRSWINVGIESHGQKEEIRERLYYQKPDKLRVDAMGPFNAPRAIVLAVEKSFRLYFVAENEVIMGELSDGVIKVIFEVDLRVSDVRSSIFANPFLDGNVSELEIESYGDEYLIRRASTIPGYREEITILARNTTVSKWQVIDSEEKIVQEISFSRYQKVGGILRPLRAVIHRPIDQTRISIESVSPEINVELAEMTFNLPIPEGTRIVQLSELRSRQTPDSGEGTDH